MCGCGCKGATNRRMGGCPVWLYSLVFLGLFADHFCGAEDNTTPMEQFNKTDEGERITTTQINHATQSSGPVSKAKTASQGIHSIVVEAGPPSLITLDGHPATLLCKFKAPTNVVVTWRRSCSPNCSQTFDVIPGNHPEITVDKNNGASNLFFHRARINDSGMYYCIVSNSDDYGQSCGTYLWVQKPRPTSFLNFRESVKNKIITVEGFLLLICAIGPGLFLLLRKRWENESLLQAKKKEEYEEENLYEGLNMDDCSMYEDISRGLQATYQDIGNVKVIDLQLEKPEKP